MQKYKNIILVAVIIAIVLGVAFWYGGNAPALHGWTTSDETPTAVNVTPPREEKETAPQSPTETEKENPPETSNIEPLPEEPEKETSEAPNPPDPEPQRQDQYRTDPPPEGKPAPIEPEDAVITEKEQTCTLSVRCDTILNNMSWLDDEKIQLVPKDGIIFAEKTVTFYEGESVFNLLRREMKRNKIHMEFVNTPIYNSAYIEGIANLYEFDCGELSGWMYKVNGWFPNYGCSRYQLKAGDKVEWVYTCDLGADVGGNYSARNGN